MRIAAYARYSSDSQREASLEDQLRNCRAYCARMGWPAPEVFQDAAISGSRNDRPGYMRLLAAAAGFDAILVDDLSRLGRDAEEVSRTVKRLRFGGVSDGVDTGRKGHKVEVGLRGLMSELFLDDLADKTHRGLSGRALSGASAGGLPFGYRVTTTGQRAIDPVQAAIVQRIFADYLAGQSAREIAAALNREGVKCASAARDPGKATTWSMSAIHGDTRRGIGILANPIYVGRQVWNRSRWLKHPDTGRRVRQERPPSDWITTEHPELAIVTPATWAAVQARLRSKGQVHDKPGGPGRPARHLLSGLLRCAECGGPMVVVDRYRYGCSVAKDRGTCASRVRFARKAAEHALLAGVREQLLTEAAFQRFQKVTTAELRRQAPDLEAVKRILVEAERERDNLMAALRAGIITPGTKAALLEAEAACTRAQAEIAAAKAYQPAQFLPRAREVWQRIVATLADTGRNVPAAREALRELLGDVIVRNDNGAPIAEIAPCSLNVVAGAGFGHSLTPPIRIPLSGA